MDHWIKFENEAIVWVSFITRAGASSIGWTEVFLLFPAFCARST